MKLILSTAAMTILFASFPSNYALAEEKVSANIVTTTTKACGFNETSTLTLTLNSIVEQAEQAKDKIKKYEDEVHQLARKAKADSVELTRINFSLNSNNRFQQNDKSDHYRMSGSISFKIAPYEQALKVFDQLKSNGYVVSFNVSSYKNNC